MLVKAQWERKEKNLPPPIPTSSQNLECNCFAVSPPPIV